MGGLKQWAPITRLGHAAHGLSLQAREPGIEEFIGWVADDDAP